MIWFELDSWENTLQAYRSKLASDPYHSSSCRQNRSENKSKKMLKIYNKIKKMLKINELLSVLIFPSTILLLKVVAS